MSTLKENLFWIVVIRMKYDSGRFLDQLRSLIELPLSKVIRYAYFLSCCLLGKLDFYF